MSGLLLRKKSLIPQRISDAELTTRQLFTASGWVATRPAGVSAGVEASVRYRPLGGVWQAGIGTLLADGTTGGAWYEGRTTVPIDPGGVTEIPVADQDQWRGWIRGLTPGTLYELEVTLDPGGGEETVLTRLFQTWAPVSEWPVASVVTLDASYASGLTLSSVTAGGSAGAYVAIEPAVGGTTITGPSDADALVVDVPYVIFRENSGGDKFTIQRGAVDYRRGIFIAQNTHDVAIQDFAISGWGRESANPGIGEGDGGIQCFETVPTGVHHIAIQNNVVSPPQYDTTSWAEAGPDGPRGIMMTHAEGFNEISHNSIMGDATHRFKDAIGQGLTSYTSGIMGDWSHVHHNRLEWFWDNACEFDGRGIVLFEENFINHGFDFISMRPVSIGPGWAIRNILGRDARVGESSNTTPFEPRGISHSDKDLSIGRTFIANNTALATLDAVDLTQAGVRRFFGGQNRVVLRNNIAATHDNSLSSIDSEGTADCDYDMYRSFTIVTPTGTIPPEQNGVPIGHSGVTIGVSSDPLHSSLSIEHPVTTGTEALALIVLFQPSTTDAGMGAVTSSLDGALTAIATPPAVGNAFDPTVGVWLLETPSVGVHELTAPRGSGLFSDSTMMCAVSLKEISIQGGPVGVVDVFAQTASGATFTRSVSVEQAGSLLLAVGGWQGDDMQPVTADHSFGKLTLPREDTGTSSSQDTSFAVATLVAAGTGATNWGFSAIGSDDYCGALIEFKTDGAAGVIAATGDPAYENDTGAHDGDYRLAAGSVGRGAGLALPSITPAGVASPDIGALHNTESMPVYGADFTA